MQALGVRTGTSASDHAHVWAEVDAPAPPPASTPSAVGHLVYVDTNHDGQRDEGEPGIAGARLSIRGPYGKPLPGVGDQTTDEHGSYHFDHVEPGVRCTVTLDLTSLDLTNLTPTSVTNGVWEPGSTTWSLSTGASADTWDAINFGFFPKVPGSYRFRYAGDSANSPATSPARRVVVLDPGTEAILPPPTKMT